MKPNNVAAARERALLLVSAIADVAPPGHPRPIDAQHAGAPYGALHREYLAELGASIQAATSWWDGRIKLSMQRNRRSRERAERDELAIAPVGPASHGRVVGAVRGYWLRCAALNESEPEAQRVPPEQFVLGWLIETEPALVAVLGRYTYLPVGLDVDGRWV